MAESMYLATVGVNEELAKIRSNRFLVQLRCDGHTGLDVGDQEATACGMATDAVKQLYPIAGEIGYTEDWLHRSKPIDGNSALGPRQRGLYRTVWFMPGLARYAITSTRFFAVSYGF